MLVTNIRGNDSTFKLLKASVFLYSKNLMPYTPTDLFIFTILEHLEELQRGFKTLMIVNPNVKIITIPDQQWAVPERVVNESHWRLRTRFPFGYRMMGDWRLTHQMRWVFPEEIYKVWLLKVDLQRTAILSTFHLCRQCNKLCTENWYVDHIDLRFKNYRSATNQLTSSHATIHATTCCTALFEETTRFAETLKTCTAHHIYGCCFLLLGVFFFWEFACVAVFIVPV